MHSCTNNISSRLDMSVVQFNRFSCPVGFSSSLVMIIGKHFVYMDKEAVEFLFLDPKDLNPFLLVAQVTQVWVKEDAFMGAAVKIMAWSDCCCSLRKCCCSFPA